MYYSLGVSKLNNVAGELASFSFPLVRLWSGGATRVGGPTYFQRHAMVPARCVRDDTGGRLCSPAVQLELRPACVAWSVAWRAQVKPGGGEECDSANKVAPRRRKRPGFSLSPSSSLPLAHLPEGGGGSPRGIRHIASSLHRAINSGGDILRAS